MVENWNHRKEIRVVTSVVVSREKSSILLFVHTAVNVMLKYVRLLSIHSNA